MVDDFLLLGPEGDRLDALAAMHGIVASLSLAVARRNADGNHTRRVGRQARALRTLATALARAFLEPAVADFEAIADLMNRAAAAERYGVPHEGLVTMPQAWPLRGLSTNPATLALMAAMRLREALQERLLASESPRRAMQLRVIRDLERDVLAIGRDLKNHTISTAEALRRVRARFAAAEPLIGGDLAELLGAADASTEASDVRPAA